MTEQELLTAWHKNRRSNTANYTRELLVAVPPEVSVPFHDVYHGFHEALKALRDNYRIIDEDIENYRHRPMLADARQLFYETRNNCLYHALIEAKVPKYVWVVYFFGEGEDRNEWKGFYVRDATQKTKLVFTYVKDKETAIYQIEDGKTYQRREKNVNRTRVK
jgi:hypothetical protein